MLPEAVAKSRLLSNRIAEYCPELNRLARKYVGRHGAEHEDLVQEGAIFVWQSLEKEVVPSEEHIQNRMRNWVRTLEYQTRPYRTSFEKMMEDIGKDEEVTPEHGFDWEPEELYP